MDENFRPYVPRLEERSLYDYKNFLIVQVQKKLEQEGKRKSLAYYIKRIEEIDNFDELRALAKKMQLPEFETNDTIKS